MQAPELNMDQAADAPIEPVRVWVESGEGSIARGVVEFLTEEGALLQLVGGAHVDVGADVEVRLSFQPTSPTVGLAARVLWVRSTDESSACELAWLPGSARAQLASLLNTAGAA